MTLSCPRVVIAGTGGDSGKTLVSLSLLLAWRRQGHRVAAFKKGPDYIDRAWLAWASGMEARNLDSFLVPASRLLGSFGAAAAGARVSVVEGNRGLHDGMDGEGTYSTAELAKLLRAPVVLVLNVTKTTRTAAAVALGCQRMDQSCNIAAVILNRVSSARHERVIREAVASATGLPVLGAIPRRRELASLLPDRHLGLVTPAEHPDAERLREGLEELGSHLDLEGLLAVAGSAPPLDHHQELLGLGEEQRHGSPGARVRIGLMEDLAFSFYYPENLAALKAAGAELVPISATKDARLPEVDALFIGGGFPETQAAALEENTSMRGAVREASKAGLPIYAECGGLMYLSESFTWRGRTHEMAGVFPLRLAVEERPQGHGYMEVETVSESPFLPAGARLRGHEFHYSRVPDPGALDGIPTVYRVLRGTGLGRGRDGLLVSNTLASYLHLHALGAPGWAEGLVAAARRHRHAEGGSKGKMNED